MLIYMIPHPNHPMSNHDTLFPTLFTPLTIMPLPPISISPFLFLILLLSSSSITTIIIVPSLLYFFNSLEPPLPPLSLLLAPILLLNPHLPYILFLILIPPSYLLNLFRLFPFYEIINQSIPLSTSSCFLYNLIPSSMALYSLYH